MQELKVANARGALVMATHDNGRALVLRPQN